MVNSLRTFKSKNNQQATNAPTSYYLEAALTQKPSPVGRRNT